MIEIKYPFCDVLDIYGTVVVELQRIASNISDKNETLICTCLPKENED